MVGDVGDEEAKDRAVNRCLRLKLGAIVNGREEPKNKTLSRVGSTSNSVIGPDFLDHVAILPSGKQE
jgi:hypothetical protein